MKRSFLGAAVCLAIAAVGFSTAALADPVGEWRVADGTATIKIRKCGPYFCGYVASAKDPGKDFRNPDPSKRNRSVIGIEVLFNLKAAPDDSFTGETYNADDGQIYIATLTPAGQSMQIKGCVPNGGVCGSETWTLVRK